MKDTEIKSKAIKGFAWQFLQNGATYITKFAVSIIIARILTPKDYGVVGIVNTFINIAMVFVINGFSTALIQKKDIKEEDLSTLFYAGLVLGLILYFILYLSSPIIAQFYREPLLAPLTKVNAIIIVIGMLYSVQQAIVMRNLEFRITFRTNFIGALAQGVIGILMAYRGYGVWAIVWSSLANYIVCAILMWIYVPWRPKLLFSMQALKENLPFSLKVLGTNLSDAIFNNFMSLVIGKVYNSEALAFYNKGYQFPTLIMSMIDGASNNVMFTTLSRFQNDMKRFVSALRKEIQLIMFVTAPLMFGLFGTADTFVRLLLTDKWAEAIPYVRLGCLICLFWPFSVKIHALNSKNKSGVSLIVKIINNTATLLLVVVTAPISVYAMVWSNVIAKILNNVLMTIVTKKYLNYGILDQIKDPLLSIVLAAFMGFLVQYLGSMLQCSLLLKLVLQTITGICLYAILSWLFNKSIFKLLLSNVHNTLATH